jgi:tRNA(Ile)-lysidine synthetase-like protein
MLLSAQPGPPGEYGPGTAATGRRFSNASAFSYEIALCARGESTVVITEIRRRFRLKVIDWPVPRGENVYVLDKDLLHPPLVLRSWRPGDSFRPQGRRSAHKLKHFFRLNHVDVRDRAGWPVLTSAGALVWARGMPVAAEVAPRSTTQTGVLIAEEGF